MKNQKNASLIVTQTDDIQFDPLLERPVHIQGCSYGLTDAEIAELTEHFKKNTIADHGRYRTVKPDVVLEIAFNSIQPSTRHASGLALRFPRIKGIRRDKNVDSIDTLQYARELAGYRATLAGSLAQARK